ncbi:MAG: hypothetical protein CMJ51_07055 [Planctomycetaceae bacterium]|nr:hypothetical protein [Planctomycetaceae bacterium]
MHLLNHDLDAPDPPTGRRRRSLGIEWYGQTGASLCWIASVLAYGMSSPGDYLQMSAASAWLIANITAALPGRND